MKVWKCLLAIGCLFVNHTKATDLFRPLPTEDKCNLSLVKWVPIPFRIQYHGFVESSKLNRYIFMIDGEIVYLQTNETAPQQFVLKQVLQNGQQVLIEDQLTHQLHLLNSGVISYVPGKFECELQDQKTGDKFTFSDEENCYKSENKEILVSQKDSDLHVWEITEDSEPMLCIFPAILLK